MLPERPSSDTIAAIATPRGLGGIGIVRISGPHALKILRSMFQKHSRMQEHSGSRHVDFKPSRLEHGWISDAHGRVLDEALAVYMPGPGSYTGENVAEIHCHGGLAVTEAVLGAALDRGARLAQAGEFTRRAFLNGRMDLTQAEAVAEMIAAPTLEGVYLARNKLEGRLAGQLADLRSTVDDLRARLYLYIDFPDEADEEGEAGGEDVGPHNFRSDLRVLQSRVKSLLNAAERARLWREGALAVLAGQVNVGKSSLLNALLGRKRAIVSDTPGTTRDFIEESVNLGGLPVRLADTAGLRESRDHIETEGMELAQDLLSRAQAVLLVLDASCLGSGPLSQEDLEIIRNYGPESGFGRVHVILNKCDLVPPGRALPRELHGCPCMEVSAKSGQGLDEMAEQIGQFLRNSAQGLNFNQDAPPSLRQAAVLRQVLEELETLDAEYSGNVPAELMSVRLDAAAARLTDLIGISSTEDILSDVFSNFCIGK